MNRLASFTSTAGRFKGQYGSLIKSRQTFLLTLTGVAGYLCQRPVPFDWIRFLSMAASLFVAISGCTVLNMVFDRDIDGKMARTSRRPLVMDPAGAPMAAWLGFSLLALGLLWAAVLSLVFFGVVLGGACLDVLVYTLWLKRRTVWSIFLGGLSGGMPILAGRTIAVGRVDLPGLLLALAIICWIPSHNLTLDMLYPEDYRAAGVPAFPNVYGATAAYILITLSNLLTASLMVILSSWLHLPILSLVVLVCSGAGLLGLTLHAWMRPSRRATGLLFKFASFYMLACMLLLSFAVLA